MTTATAPATAGTVPPAHRGEAWMLGGIVLVGILVRFPAIRQQSFWYDEAFTRAIVAHDFGHVLRTVPKTESTPYLYYVLTWGWAQIFGLGEAGLRSFSAVCGTLTIVVMWILGRRLAGPRVAAVAGLLTAISPILVWYSQEARAYSLLVVLSAITVVTMLRALQVPSAIRLLTWSVSAGLALATHYFAVFLLIPEAAWLAVALLRERGARAIGFAPLVAGALPVLATGIALAPLLQHQNDGRASSLATGGGSIAYRLAQLARQDLLGFGQPSKKLVLGIAAILAVAAGWVALQRTPQGERAAGILPATLGIVGLLLALIISSLGTDYFESRNLLETWPALALVVAIVLGGVHGGRLATGIALLFAVLSLVCIGAVVNDPALQRPDWRGAAHAIGPATTPRALVGDRLARMSLTPYLAGLTSLGSNGASVDEIAALEATASQAGGKAETMNRAAPPTGFRLAREVRTDTYKVIIYRSLTPRRVTADALLRLGPAHGEDRVLLQP